MPSPLLHLATGAGICLLDRRAVENARWRLIAPVMLASVLPDFDVVPGLLIADPNRFHGVVSHSIGFAVIAAALPAAFNRVLRWRVAAWTFVAWLAHCLLDTLTVDLRPPLGVPLLWPLSAFHVHASRPVFPQFRHGYDDASLDEFFGELFSLGNLDTLAIEALVAAGVLVACAALGRRRRWKTRRANDRSSQMGDG